MFENDRAPRFRCTRFIYSLSRLIVLSLVFGVSFTGAHGQEQHIQPLDLAQIKALTLESLDLESADIRDLHLPNEAWTPFSVSLDLGGSLREIELVPHSVRSWDFKVLVQGMNGILEEWEAPPPRTYTGSVAGFPDSVVAASLKDGSLSAIIVLTPHEQWVVQPLTDVIEDASPLRHVVFNVKDIAGRGEYRCGNDDFEETDADCDCASTKGGQNSTTGFTGIMICDIGFDADVQFYNKNGNSVTNTVNDIEKIVNGMRTVYERDTEITYEITTIVVRTVEPDPYTTNNAGDLLNEFKVEWNQNMDGIKRDVAHLMTGKNLGGTTIGVAFPSVICTKNQAYGLSESRFTTNLNQRVTLTCHEVGHNWSSGHCDGNGDCHIMCSVLGGCNGIGLPNFGADSAAKIITFRDSRTCLWELGDPIAVPFSETFPTTTLDQEKWSLKNGASIETTALNEPSAPNSLKLDASGSGAYEEDEIRSNFILLQGLSNIEFSYYTQHRGVENGEKLIVEYWSMTDDWVEINSIVSNGVNQNNFDFHSHTLPFQAYHNEFRIRFRTEVNALGDDWYIDNIFVGQPQPDPPYISAITPKAGIEGGGTPVTINGGNFTTNPAMTVEIGGVNCASVNVQNSTTLTCLTGSNTSGFKDVEVSNTYGNDILSQAFRYFPVNVDPFNATDIDTSSLDAPVDVSLIFSGYPFNNFIVFFSFLGGPTPTPYGTMGLGFPVLYLFPGFLNSEGYMILPLTLDPAGAPLDFYLHALGLNSSGKPVWSTGGNNPNGSESIWIHLNN